MILLHDIDEQIAKRNECIGNRLTLWPDVPGKRTYHTCCSLVEAPDGEVFVVVYILPGSFDNMDSDVHLPERLWINKSVGNTNLR